MKENLKIKDCGSEHLNTKKPNIMATYMNNMKIRHSDEKIKSQSSFRDQQDDNCTEF